MKYYINNKIFNAYGATPQLCVLDSVHFFEFNSKRSEDANFICFASNKAIAEMALKKAQAYGIPLTLRQAKNCLASCQQNGKLVKVPNFPNGEDDVPLCLLTTNKYVWMTNIRADMTQEEIDSLKNKKSRVPFEKRRPELVKTRDRLMQYLRSRNISVAGRERQVEAQIEKIERSFDDPQYFLDIINGYLDFLEGGDYQFQLEKNKYTPRMTKLTDISGKFDSIRNFHRDRSGWFDPSKHLSETFNK